MKIVITTLGCKVNQYESDVIAEKLRAEGHEVFLQPQFADIFILNSCAVTNEAERKSRQQISKFNKLNPNAKIFVLGCASQKNHTQFAALPNVKYVIGNANKTKVLDKIKKLDNKKKLDDLPKVYENLFLSSSSNTRAYVKIQDGCNRFCSYCIIPYVRGRSRSRDILNILTEVDNLKKNNVKEIILTGIDISDYRIDEKLGLCELMKQLDSYSMRIRLSSMEVNLITDEFLETLKNMKNFCPHFHLSMQSGSSSVLQKMNRHYTSKQFLLAVKKIRKNFKNASITTDIIVGFPGETQAEFNETVKTVKKAKFAYMHIFPFSRRSGTAVDKLLTSKDNSNFFLVDGSVVKNRTNILNELNKKFMKSFNQQQIGKSHEIILEEKLENFWVGHSKNFVKIYVNAEKFTELHSNDLINVKVVALAFKDGVLGEVIKNK